MLSPTVRDAEPYARRAYTAFLLLRPDVAVEGLFFANDCFHIVCPAVGAPPGDREILETFAQVAPMAVPLVVTPNRPVDALQLPGLTREELESGFGLPRTSDELTRDLALRLPSGFPLVGIEERDRCFDICVSRTLTRAETDSVTRVWTGMGTICDVAVRVVGTHDSDTLGQLPDRHDDFERRFGDALDLGAIRLKRALPTAVRRCAEEDEQLWRDRGDAPQRVVDDGRIWNEVRGSACLVGTVLPPAPIRPMLSLYSAVNVEAPLRERLDETLAAFGVTGEEFRTLVQRGNIRVLVPHAVERYDLSWLAELVEASPQNVLFSRRLLLASIADQRRRLPFFDITATPDERRALLRALHYGLGEFAHGDPVMLRALRRSLGEHWAYASRTRAGRGAMAALTGGLASFGTELVREIHNKDMTIEIGSAAMCIEWAGALGADYVPHASETYSEENAAGLLLALSSGIDAQQPMLTSREFTVTEDLLSIGGDVDVIELAAHWGGGDAARLRALVRSIARPGRSDNEVRELVDLWNREIAAYDGNPDRVKAYGLTSIALSGVPAAAHAVAPIPELVPLLAFLLPLVMPYMQTNFGEKWAEQSAFVGEVNDWLQAIMAKTLPETVMLARARKRLSTMKLPQRARKPG